MSEYHDFGALPYTFPSDRHEVVGHLIKRLARISPATTPRALAKLGWHLPMCPFVFSIQHKLYAVYLMAPLFKNINYTSKQV